MKIKYTIIIIFVLTNIIVRETGYGQHNSLPFFHLPSAPQRGDFSRWTFGQVGYVEPPPEIGGSVGLNWLDGEPYYIINITPEFAIDKFGIGFDVALRVSTTTGKIYKPDWSDGAYKKFIRYIRWGAKGDDVYARLGILDYARLGHGFIMYLYKNSPSFNARRIGAEFDWNLGSYGLESVFSDFGETGIFGVRSYSKILKYTTFAQTPILGDMEAGITIAGDLRMDAQGVDSSGKNKGQLGIFGFDVGFPLVKKTSVQSTLYVDYAKMFSYGNGTAIGIETEFHGLGVFDIFTKLERRYSGDKFIPSYFDAFYEIDRIDKAKYLDSLVSPGPGIYGDVTFSILKTLNIRGAYQKLDNYPNSGILHFGTNTGNILPMVVVDAGYDKKYILDFHDVFTLDNRSLLYTSFGYKPYAYMTVALVYTWTFEKDKYGAYQPQERVETKVMFSAPI